VGLATGGNAQGITTLESHKLLHLLRAATRKTLTPSANTDRAGALPVAAAACSGEVHR